MMNKAMMKSRNIRKTRAEHKMPTGLIIAQLFMVVMIICYVFKITGSMMDIAEDGQLFPSVVNVFMLMLNLVFLVTTVFALLGLSSRRAESWKKVVKTCFTFTLSSFLSAYLVQSDSYTHAFDFNPYATAIVLGLVVLMMLFSEDIKKFYTPPLTKVRPTASWARYIVFGKLYDSEYEIRFESPAPKEEEAPNAEA